MVTAEQIIAHFHLEPLPHEGGFLRQTYCSAEVVVHTALPTRYHNDKPFSDATLYLLMAGPHSFGALHMLPSDEIYHFYVGDPVEMVLLYSDGSTIRHILGHDILNGQSVQCVAPGGVWQGVRLLAGGGYALLGTTLAPAFSDDDYRGGDRELLLQQFPAQADLIREMTR
jgi:predicted cupin superfamily sugar epimerase